MDLVNRKVKSKALGIGTVVEQDDSYVIVQFAAKKSKFQYPEAFRKFLTAEDEEIQQALLTEIAAADARIEEAKIKAEEARKAVEQAKLEELAAKAGRKTTSKPVSRVLSRAIIYLGYVLPHISSDLTREKDGQPCISPIWSCSQWGLPSRPVT